MSSTLSASCFLVLPVFTLPLQGFKSRAHTETQVTGCSFGTFHPRVERTLLSSPSYLSGRVLLKPHRQQQPAWGTEQAKPTSGSGRAHSAPPLQPLPTASTLCIRIIPRLALESCGAVRLAASLSLSSISLFLSVPLCSLSVLSVSLCSLCSLCFYLSPLFLVFFMFSVLSFFPFLSVLSLLFFLYVLSASFFLSVSLFSLFPLFSLIFLCFSLFLFVSSSLLPLLHFLHPCPSPLPFSLFPCSFLSLCHPVADKTLSSRLVCISDRYKTKTRNVKAKGLSLVAVIGEWRIIG